jgi:hypothetical protein
MGQYLMTNGLETEKIIEYSIQRPNSLFRCLFVCFFSKKLKFNQINIFMLKFSQTLFFPKKPLIFVAYFERNTELELNFLNSFTNFLVKMKKLMLLVAFFGAFSLSTASAQSCAQKTAEKSCCAGKPCAATKMASAAKSDPSIESRLDPAGSTYYVRKESADNGQVRLVDVKFDEPTGKFVNVSPNQAAATATPAAGMVKKEAACATEKKACCKGGEKACVKKD